MSDFKTCSNEEKITHLLSGELSIEEQGVLEREIALDEALLKEKQETEDFIELLELHSNHVQLEEGLGIERKNKIFNSKTRVKTFALQKQAIWGLVAILFLSVAIYLLSVQQPKEFEEKPLKTSSTAVFGAKSFHMAMPSGTYYFTLKDGALTINNIESLDGVDYLKTANIQKGDKILSINNLAMKNLKMDEWRSLILSQIGNPNLFLKYERDNEIHTYMNKAQ